MAKKRKRAPGGGRKPAGPISGKSATLMTRVRPSTREALENTRPVMTDGRRKSLSQWAEEMIVRGLADYARSAAPDDARVFGGLLGHLLDVVCGGAADRRPFDWRTSSFAARAFALAAKQLIEDISRMNGVDVDGDVAPLSNPEKPLLGLLGPINTPEARATYAVQIVGHLLQSAPALERLPSIESQISPPLSARTKVGIRQEDESLAPLDLAPSPWPADALEAVSYANITFAQARAALLPPKKT
jgi:hypothetical protein